MKSLFKVGLSAVVAALALTAITATAQSSLVLKEDAAQLKSDKAALQRQLKRLDADEARLVADTKSGRMSAESKDAFEVYQAQQGVKGAQKDIAADKAASPQMKSDRAALERQIKRLDAAEARLVADTKSGRTAAESKDSATVYQDKQAVSGEKKAVAADTAKQKADQKK